MCVYGCYIWVILEFSGRCSSGWCEKWLLFVGVKVIPYACNKSRMALIANSSIVQKYFDFNIDFFLCTDFLCRYTVMEYLMPLRMQRSLRLPSYSVDRGECTHVAGFSTLDDFLSPLLTEISLSNVCVCVLYMGIFRIFSKV